MRACCSIALAVVAAAGACNGGGAEPDARVDAEPVVSDADPLCALTGEREVYAPVGSTVVFYLPSGAVQDVVTIGVDGKAIETVHRCTDVTVAIDRSQMITIKGGWTVGLGRTPRQKDPAAPVLSVSYLPFAGADGYTFTTAGLCSATTWYYASPAHLALDPRCFEDHDPLVGIARGHDGHALAYATAMVWRDDDGTPIDPSIRTWRTDFTSHVVTVDPPAGWVSTYRVALAYQWSNNEDSHDLYATGAPSGSPIRLPPIGTEMFLHVTATGDSNAAEYFYEMLPPLDPMFEVSVAAAYPYLPITKTADASPRPTIAWSAAAPLDGLEVVHACAYWDGPEPREWCVVDDPTRGNTIAFPALPDSLAMAGAPTSTGLTFRGAGYNYDGWVGNVMASDEPREDAFPRSRIYVGDEPDRTSMPVWFQNPQD